MDTVIHALVILKSPEQLHVLSSGDSRQGITAGLAQTMTVLSPVLPMAANLMTKACTPSYTLLSHEISSQTRAETGEPCLWGEGSQYISST